MDLLPFILILIACVVLAIFLKARAEPIADDAQVAATREAFHRQYQERLSHIRQRAEEFADVLGRKHRQLARQDDYGNWLLDEWWREIGYFLRNVIGLEAAQPIFPDALIIVHEVACAARARMDTDAGLLAAPFALSPSEFEHECAAELRRHGWAARAVGASGDQGSDVLASKDALSVVLQCKRYSSPVGNGAVQEAHAARAHFSTNAACVVSNAPFTKAARELAATTGVLLLHPTQLAKLDQLLGCSSQE